MWENSENMYRLGNKKNLKTLKAQEQQRSFSFSETRTAGLKK